jgi:hypothetical protein
MYLYLALCLVFAAACLTAYKLGYQQAKRKIEIKTNDRQLKGLENVEFAIDPFGPKLQGHPIGEPESRLQVIRHPQIVTRPVVVQYEVSQGVTLRQYQSKSDPRTTAEVLYYDGTHDNKEIPRDSFEMCGNGVVIPGEEFRKDWEVFYAEELPKNPGAHTSPTDFYHINQRAVPGEKSQRPPDEITDEQFRKLAEQYQFPLETHQYVGPCEHRNAMRQVYHEGKARYVLLGPGHRVWCHECRTTFTLPPLKVPEATESEQKTA